MPLVIDTALQAPFHCQVNRARPLDARTQRWRYAHTSAHASSGTLARKWHFNEMKLRAQLFRMPASIHRERTQAHTHTRCQSAGGKRGAVSVCPCCTNRCGEFYTDTARTHTHPLLQNRFGRGLNIPTLIMYSVLLESYGSWRQQEKKHA